MSQPQEPAGPVNPAHPAYSAHPAYPAPAPAWQAAGQPAGPPPGFYPAPAGYMAVPSPPAQPLLLPLPPGTQLSSHGKRFGAYLLDGVLMVFTFGIGWLIWALIRWSEGQTPAKQLLNMRVIKVDRMRVASWGDMFVRDFLTKGLLVALLGLATCGIGHLVAILMIFAGTNRQALWDRMCNTFVVDDPHGVLVALPQ